MRRLGSKNIEKTFNEQIDEVVKMIDIVIKKIAKFLINEDITAEECLSYTRQLKQIMNVLNSLKERRLKK